MRLRSARTALLTAVALAAGATTAFAPSAPSVPVFMTDNVEVVGAFPEPSVVAVTFDPAKPVMYATSLTGFTTWDISDPTLPLPLGKLPFPHYSNENVKLGVRDDGTRFVMAGFDLAGYSPQAGATDTRGTNRFVVIDVTDPAAPAVAATVNTTTRTHTMGCANTECTHAYTAGSGGKFDIYDMSDITAPELVRTYESTLLGGNSTFGGGVGHDWDVDDAGVAWWVGSGGVVAFDVTDPENPVVLNSSDFRGQSKEFNKYISHNSQRPDAELFTSRAPEDVDRYPTRPSIPGMGSVEPRENVDVDGIRDGEIVFVTEEDLSATGQCSSTRGGLQAWHVQELDAERYEATNPTLDRAKGGTITPIGKWTTEATEVDDPWTQGNVAVFCSAHYFDVHHTGIVAQAWYMQGLRLIDGRDPTQLTQIGYFVTGAQEIFGAKWVPEYGEDGVQTGLDTNILYTEDPSRGIEILRVDLPEDGEAVDAVRAPILPEWRERAALLSVTSWSPDFGYACRIG